MKDVSASEVKTRAPLFVNSWTAVNAFREENGQDELVLKSGTTLADLQTKVAVLDAKYQAALNQDQQRVIIAAERDGVRTQTRDAMEAWRKAALYNLDGSSLLADLPTLPHP